MQNVRYCTGEIYLRNVFSADLSLAAQGFAASFNNSDIFQEKKSQ